MDYQSILAEHKKLRAAIQRLREVAEFASAEMAGALGEVTDLIQTHFRMEEESGFFRDIVLQRPDLDCRASKLQKQHTGLLATFESLLTASGEASPEDLGPRVLVALDALQAHESAEIHLMQDSALVDIGALD